MQILKCQKDQEQNKFDPPAGGLHFAIFTLLDNVLFSLFVGNM